MYVTTFYSFKGGVGRTLALMNCAAELCLRGKKVLVVDFDLEAPGIESFGVTPNEGKNEGVVEFISDYLKIGVSQNVMDYLYRVEMDDYKFNEGELWVMPAGKTDGTYGHRLGGIEWQDLYDNRDGYLLLEDMKDQWEAEIQPDYVLIDSRTGHTEITGICTRQLPTAVVCLFKPNIQSLPGLKSIVREIRDTNDLMPDNIHLHFVASDVPDLDDADGILEDIINKFRDGLSNNFSIPMLYVYHYNSMDLVDQKVFTIKRPGTSLAREFRELVDEIVIRNREDREGAKEYTKRISKSDDISAFETSEPNMEVTLGDLEERYLEDKEILFNLSRIRLLQGRVEIARTLVTKVLDLENNIDFEINFINSLMMRAMMNRMLGDNEEAIADWINCLGRPSLPLPAIRDALRGIGELKPEKTPTPTEIPSLDNLEQNEMMELINNLNTSREALLVSEYLSDLMIEVAGGPNALPKHDQLELSLRMIGVGRFNDAITLLEDTASQSGSATSIAVSFNIAISKWGKTGAPDPLLFEEVIQKSEYENSKVRDANYFQCIALAYAITGKPEEADKLLDQAEQIALRMSGTIFNCWRYLKTTSHIFLEDLNKIRRFNLGKNVKPVFMKTS